MLIICTLYLLIFCRGRKAILDAQLHAHVHRLGTRLNVTLEMHFHVGNSGVRHAADDLRPKLRDDAVHDGLRDTVEPVLDELLLIWVESEAIPVLRDHFADY